MDTCLDVGHMPLPRLPCAGQRLGIPMPPPLPGMAGLPSRPPGLVDDEDGEFEDGAGPSGLGMPGGRRCIHASLSWLLLACGQ